MPQKSRWTVLVPEVSIPTLMFGSPTTPLGDGIAYVDADDQHLSMTWDSFRLWSQRFAAGLRVAGLQPGERIVISSANDVFFPVVFMGTVMASGIYSSANARFVPRELAYQLQATDAKFLLVGSANLTAGLEAAKLIGMGRERIFLFDDAPLEKDGSGEDPSETGVRHWRYLLASKDEGRDFVWEELSPEASKTRGVGLMFSSGLVSHQSVDDEYSIDVDALVRRVCQKESNSRITTL